jgi:adenylate kinase
MTTPSIAVALSRVSAKQRKLESAQELVQIASRERAESMRVAVVAGASMIQVGNAAGISRQMVHRILSGDTSNGHVGRVQA